MGLGLASGGLLGDGLHLLVIVGGGEEDAPAHLRDGARGCGEHQLGGEGCRGGR